MPRRARHPSGRPAFSLIELLVAIAIIAVLIAILFPVIRSAQSMARTTACLANCRQIGILLNAYLVTSDGTLPALNNRAATTDPGPALDTALLPASGDTRVYRCPADDRGLYDTTGSSYFWNFTVSGQRIDDLFSIIGGDEPSRVPLVNDKEGFHPELRDKIVVLYADGHADRSLNFSLNEDAPAPSSPGPGG
ncbi:MAG: prepilin-type N-terminal cleavage/methylation domain-containing protein [Planctomycetota bacterium]